MATILYILAKALPYWMPITLVGQNVSPHGGKSGVSVEYYYYNEQTGQVQWENPGGVPFEDETGMRYWLIDGTRVYQDPILWRYVWVEQWSTELNRVYYYNQESRVSVWERPPDLAWRRIATEADD
jgi:hypothetical protein